MHQRPIVDLIRKYQSSTIRKKMARNELRLKYHYHTCPFRMRSELFLDAYDLLYSRTFGFNRYTIILGKLNFLLIKCYSKIDFSDGKYFSINCNNTR